MNELKLCKGKFDCNQVVLSTPPFAVKKDVETTLSSPLPVLELNQLLSGKIKPNLRSHRDLNLDRWIQSPECLQLPHGTHFFLLSFSIT